MFGFGKRKASAGSDRFYVLMLSGNAAALKIMQPILELPDAAMERTSISIDEDGEGGLVVTADDPDILKAQYLALGFRVGTVTIPRRRPNETAQMVSMDLKLTGEYRSLRQKWLDSN